MRLFDYHALDPARQRGMSALEVSNLEMCIVGSLDGIWGLLGGRAGEAFFRRDKWEDEGCGKTNNESLFDQNVPEHCQLTI